MKLDEIMYYRRIDAINLGLNVQSNSWYITRTGRYTDDGAGTIVTMSMNDIGKSNLIVFDAVIDYDENVVRSTSISVIEL
jgi:hypothetical protein